MLIDSHCHIADSEFYGDEREAVYQESVAADVTMIVASESERSSYETLEFVRTHERTYALVGVHPHNAVDGWGGIAQLIEDNRDQIVGIGEIGLDYYYDHSPREVQQQALREQLALAVRYDLPVSFHVRDAFDDFWPIFDEFSGIRGVLHSFTDTQTHVDEALKRGLYIGINGISTFTKDDAQRELYKLLDLSHILLETDAPFLTPAPFRGKMNKPAYIGRVAEHQAMLKSLSPDEVIRLTTNNAKALYRI